MYTAHNYQFLAFSAAMEGRQAETIEAARQSRALISDHMLLTTPGFDCYVAELKRKGVTLRILDLGMDTSTPTGPGT